MATPSHPEATLRLPSGSLVANREAPRGYPEATPRLPRGYPEATPRLPRGYPEATPRLPRGYPEATPRLPPGYLQAPGEDAQGEGRMKNVECRMARQSHPKPHFGKSTKQKAESRNAAGSHPMRPQSHPKASPKPGESICVHLCPSVVLFRVDTAQGFPASLVKALTILIFASLAASITLTITPNGAAVSALMANWRSGLLATCARSSCFRRSTVTGVAFAPRRRTPLGSMLTTRGGASLARFFCAWDDSGRESLRAGCCLKVVVTIRKMSSTMRMSIRATMITAGACRRLCG